MGHWTISRGLEPIYVDDPWDNPDYDPRDNDMDCMMCPCTREECDERHGNGKGCYWDEVWGKDAEACEKAETTAKPVDTQTAITEMVESMRVNREH
jgi:hypothetical protein